MIGEHTSAPGRIEKHFFHLVKDTSHLIVENWSKSVGLYAALFISPLILFASALFLPMGKWDFTIHLIVVLFCLLLLVLCYYVLRTALLDLAVSDYENDSHRFLEALGNSVKKYTWQIFGINLTVWLSLTLSAGIVTNALSILPAPITALCAVLLSVFHSYLYSRLGLAECCLIGERLTILGAIRRSWIITGGSRFWLMLGRAVLFSILCFLIVGGLVSATCLIFYKKTVLTLYHYALFGGFMHSINRMKLLFSFSLVIGSEINLILLFLQSYYKVALYFDLKNRHSLSNENTERELNFFYVPEVQTMADVEIFEGDQEDITSEDSALDPEAS